ncbi:MAG: hypothetical protein HY763_09005 [Planctomycetes bacterium]|nr:hypothetical protein [Planctomycetota bacterium]
MSLRSFLPARFVRLGCAAVAFGGAFLTPATPSAKSVDPLLALPIRVEEDWKLVLNEPDGGIDSPQFHTVMSPYTDLDSYYAQVTWNYRETPDFLSGGLQLQSWNGESQLNRRSIAKSQLSTTAETITWTQSLTIAGALLSFDILNGNSTTWGTFGRDMTIALDASLSFLGDYSPDVSAANACVTYGSNRVDLFVLTEVRWYGADGSLVAVDSTPRVVYELGDDE